MRLSLVLIILCSFVFPCCISRGSKSGAFNSNQQVDARSYFIEIARQNSDKRVKISSATEPLSYGLEFEGMSPRIWKYYGLRSNELAKRINIMPETQQEIVLRWLFYTLINEKKLIPVIEAGAVTYTIEVPKQNALTADLTQLKTMFAKFLEQASPSPFSHFDFDTRTKLINNYALKQAYLDKRDGIEQVLQQSGREKKEIAKEVANRLGERGSHMPHTFFYFFQLIDLDGLSIEDSRHLKKIKNEMNRRWEIVSKPVKTYGAFEEQLAWFEREFGSLEDQHKRFVFGVEPMDHFSDQVENSPEHLAIRVQAHFLAELLQLYLALAALEKGVDLGSNDYTNFNPSFSDVSVYGRGNETKSSTRVIDDEFYSDGVSIEIRHGLGTRDERAIVAGVIMEFLQRRGFNSKWRGIRAIKLMAGNVLDPYPMKMKAKCDSSNRFPDSMPFPGSDFIGDPLRIRTRILNLKISCNAFVLALHPLLIDWSALVSLDARFAQLRSSNVMNEKFFLDSEIDQLEENRIQFAKLDYYKERGAYTESHLQFRAMLVAAAQRFVTKHRAADVFLEIIKSALQPDGAD